MVIRLVAFLLLSLVLSAQQNKPNAGQGSFEISGTLIDALHGQPIAKGRVTVAPVSSRGDSISFDTSEDGHFSFTRLAGGKYVLSGERRGYLTQAFKQHEGYSTSIVVGAGVDSSNLLFALSPESSITGVIRDEAGEGVRDAQVMLYNVGVVGGMNGIRLRSQVVTDDQGGYHFPHLQGGKYIVAVSARVWYAQRPKSESKAALVTFSGGFQSQFSSMSQGGKPFAQGDYAEQEGPAPLDVAFPITFYPGTTESSSAGLISLRQGDKFVADINLQPVQALHLQLSGDGKPPENRRYPVLETKLLNRATLAIPVETRIGPSGDMEMVGVPPGHYTVKLVDPSKTGETVENEIDAVSNGPASQIEIQGGRISVHLQLDPGTPNPTQSFIQIFNMKTREYFNEKVTESGYLEYKQKIPPGTYEVALTNGAGSYIRLVSATGARVSGRTIDFRGTGAVNLTLAIGHGQGMVTGTAMQEGENRLREPWWYLFPLIPEATAFSLGVIKAIVTEPLASAPFLENIPCWPSMTGGTLSGSSPASLSPICLKARFSKCFQMENTR